MNFSNFLAALIAAIATLAFLVLLYGLFTGQTFKEASVEIYSKINELTEGFNT